MEDERLLVYRFAEGTLDTTITWTLRPEGEGTRLVLTHAGFDLDSPMGRQAYEAWVTAGRASWSVSTPSWATPPDPDRPDEPAPVAREFVTAERGQIATFWNPVGITHTGVHGGSVRCGPVRM